MSFKPALIIVDVQEDFCPPNGALAVAGGRDIVPLINECLDYPFALKVATKDFHPQDHISFASNHPPPNNKPFESTVTLVNPHNPEEQLDTRLWPDHCVQGTKGSELLSELHINKVDCLVEKGQDKHIEMYSAFADPFKSPCVARSSLAETLHKAGITDVYVVGLAADYCVKYTAIDAQSEGFNTWVVGEATRAVDPSAMEQVHKEYEERGVKVISRSDVQILKVKNLPRKPQEQSAKNADQACESVLD